MKSIFCFLLSFCFVNMAFAQTPRKVQCTEKQIDPAMTPIYKLPVATNYYPTQFILNKKIEIQPGLLQYKFSSGCTLESKHEFSLSEIFSTASIYYYFPVYSVDMSKKIVAIFFYPMVGKKGEKTLQSIDLTCEHLNENTSVADLLTALDNSFSLKIIRCNFNNGLE